VLRHCDRLYPVTHFEPHPGVTWQGTAYPARAAFSGGRRGITVEEADDVRVLDATPDPDRVALALTEGENLSLYVEDLERR
jgi:hypothetical protein